MMFHVTRRMSAAFVAAMVFGAAMCALPARAIAADSGRLAQASPPAAGGQAQPAAPARPGAADRVEARIKSLHDQLGITAAQEPQWNAVAQVMRDNAKAMSDLVRDRGKDAANMTAVDDLRSYQALADAHVAGVKKLIPAFETLYAALSDAQKKNADAAFRHRPRHAPPKKTG